MSERTSSDVEESSSISPHEAEVEQDPPESKKHTASSGVPPGKSIVPPENVEGHLMQLKSKKTKSQKRIYKYPTRVVGYNARGRYDGSGGPAALVS